MKRKVCLIALAGLFGFTALFAGNQPGSSLEPRNESRQMAPSPMEATPMVPEAATAAVDAHQSLAKTENVAETVEANTAAHEQSVTKKEIRKGINHAKGDTGDILAILGFCFGLIGFLFAFLFFGGGFLFGITGIILAAIGLKRGTSQRTLGILGIVFGGLAVLVSLLLVALIIAVLVA